MWTVLFIYYWEKRDQSMRWPLFFTGSQLWLPLVFRFLGGFTGRLSLNWFNGSSSLYFFLLALAPDSSKKARIPAPGSGSSTLILIYRYTLHICVLYLYPATLLISNSYIRENNYSFRYLLIYLHYMFTRFKTVDRYRLNTHKDYLFVYKLIFMIARDNLFLFRKL